MKNSATILGLALALGAAAASSSPLITSSLSITAEPLMAKTGQDIRVDVKITNGANKPVTLAIVKGKGHAELNYEIKVTREYNQTVEPTALVGPETLPIISGKLLIELDPGESFSDYFLLNNVYNVSNPGVYIVQVQQEPVAGRAAARSNSIKVVVQ